MQSRAALQPSLADPSLADPSLTDRAPRLDVLTLAAVTAVVVGTILRFGGLDLPLWLDETFTGAIAAQPDLASLAHQLWADVNAPLYYVVMYAWTALAGVSDRALHLPSVLFSTAAVLLALRGGPGLDRRTCLIWAGLLSLWHPGLDQASEARCYALLLLLATMATVAFARMLAEPGRRNAALWAALCALAILTHYYALPLAAAQGGVFLLRHRGRALRCWPALLAFLPVLAWIAWHAPRLAVFAQPDIAWYAPLGLAGLVAAAAYVLNQTGIVLLPAMLLVRARQTPLLPRREAIAALVAGAGLLGLAVVVAAGFWRPSFIPRYAVPYEPALLLGLAAAIRAASAAWQGVPALALALFGLPSLLAPPPARPFSFAAAATAAVESGAHRLVFLWDHPSAAMQDPVQMRAVGGFFPARAGHPMRVEALAHPWREDANRALLAAAGSEPGTAILWVFDRGLPKTSVRAYPPRIEQIDPSWQCRDHVGTRFGAMLCLRGTVGG